MTTQDMIRLAQKLQLHWQQAYENQRESVIPITSAISSQLQRLRQAEHTLELARSHRLTLIESEMQERVAFQARCLRITLQDLDGVHFPLQRSYLLRDFYQDLVQLEEEFPDMQVNWNDCLLTVVTDSITLQDVELGPFSLRFHWKQWAQDPSLSCLQVIAEEPNSPEQNSEVTHPHVRDGELCTGDAEVALQKALTEGRLAEAFLMVKAVLTHYNPRSAYVRLEEWDGAACYDCGQLSNAEDRSYCEGCHHDYCQECIHYCCSCDELRCSSCMDICSHCHERCCSSCSATSVSDQLLCKNCQVQCRGCHAMATTDEIDPESGLCPECFVDDPLPSTEESLHETITPAAS